MDATVEQLGGVVIDALRAAGYLESTIGQYQKTIRYLKGFVADRGDRQALDLSHISCRSTLAYLLSDHTGRQSVCLGRCHSPCNPCNP